MTILRQFSRPGRPSAKLRRGISFALFWLIQNNLVSTTIALATERQCSSATEPAGASSKNYHHMVVLVHGYLGSYREQEYLGEALLKESKKTLSDGVYYGSNSNNNNNDNDNDNDNDNNSDGSCRKNTHRFAVLSSKANSEVMQFTTDGVAKGGERLAVEIKEWIRQQRAEVQTLEEADSSSSSTVMTLSLVGNSLGGLYIRYVLTEIGDLFGSSSNNDDDDDNNDQKILPLVFCTTSSPHLGTSQETFVGLPKWTEPYVSSVFGQKTMDDLFGVNTSTVVADMCRNSSNNSDDERRTTTTRDYLHPLQQFQKRIALANAYNTDFLVSVSSGAFLSSRSDSVHHHQDSDVVAASSIRLMKDLEHVALQVATVATTTTGTEEEEEKGTSRTKHEHEHEHDTSSCTNALDNLGWLKIFIDTRTALPSVLNFNIPELEPRPSYTSRELLKHFKQYGTVLPVAHPLNMANSKTDWYRTLTKSGQPVVDALAELLVLDMIELSENID